MVHQTKQLRTTKTKRIKHKREAKRAAGIEGQMASMLEYVYDKYTQQTQQEYNEPGEKIHLEETKQKCRLGTASKEITGGKFEKNTLNVVKRWYRQEKSDIHIGSRSVQVLKCNS